MILFTAAHLELDWFKWMLKPCFLIKIRIKKIYIVQPQGYEVKGQQENACKLLKSIYGLKQSYR